MGKCLKCGKKGLFVIVTESGLCAKCNAKKLHIQELTDGLSNTKLTIQYSVSSRTVETKQRTNGCLQPFSVDAWAGYVSPSGGFVNFAIYQVVGINPKTGRKNKRVYKEFQEKHAIKRAEIEGLVAPFEVHLLKSEAPSERQIEYAGNLGITIPDGACRLDVSALISRVTDDDECPADENLASQAHIYGVHFSRYHGRKAILSMAQDLPAEDYRDFLHSIC